MTIFIKVGLLSTKSDDFTCMQNNSQSMDVHIRVCNQKLVADDPQQ